MVLGVSLAASLVYEGAPSPCQAMALRCSSPRAQRAPGAGLTLPSGPAGLCIDPHNLTCRVGDDDGVRHRLEQSAEPDPGWTSTPAWGVSCHASCAPFASPQGDPLLTLVLADPEGARNAVAAVTPIPIDVYRLVRAGKSLYK
jgi:hypothetical protein